MAAIEMAGFILRDPVSGGSHLLWFGLAFFINALFWKLTPGSWWRRCSALTFSISISLLYGASGLYHSIHASPRTVEFFRLLDHSMIYVLIAGTYTPVVALVLRGRLRVALLCMIWGLAAVGIACKWLFVAPPYPVTVSLYIAMGWIGVLPAAQLIRALGLRAMGWLLLGGILYTAGGVCDAVKWPRLYPGLFGAHEVLHVLDMAATVVHVYFVIRYVLPYKQAPLKLVEPPVLHAALAPSAIFAHE